MSENNNTDLNEVFEEEMDDADVITVPIDETLSKSGEAADAKAVGDALSLKADKSELQAAVKVNNQPADAQGLILIDGRHIPVSDRDAETLAEAVTDLKGKTAENILMSSNSEAKTIAEVVNANAEAIESMEEMTGAKMPIESGSQTTVKAAIEARVKTVNRKVPDADGDVDLSVVPLAENLQSDKMESVEGSFIIRMTGGNASVSDGKAYPLHLFGSADHTGYVAEQLNMTVIPITRTEPDEPITATIDRDTFVAYVEESGTINLYYTSEWSADPELYGITVTGTPVAGDQITVVYVKEVRGTITVANPARLVGTGWNLFDYNNGYAHVVKYSTEYGYKIGGSYTSIQFSATLTGERTSITPSANGLFNVNSDGYVFVTGGNNTDTYILATWSDWRNGPSTGYWESYRESGIDLSAVMTTYFPNGLLAVGTIRDEIDLSAKRSISRIERLAYSEENRAAAAATGRSYDFDQNYIYIARESAVLNAITIDTTYNVSEHGLELFTETALPVITEILYGKNLRDKLERDVLTISPQDLAAEEQAQVRRNIGVMDPPLNGNGTAAQLLKTNGDGTTEWTTQGTPTDAQVGTAVSAWLEEHPEATTTVQDGAISRAKLNDDLKAKTDAVPDLKSALENDFNPELFDYTFKPTIIEGQKITSQGVISENASYSTTDYVFVGDATKFSVTSSVTSGAINAICFFDKDKVFKSSATSNIFDTERDVSENCQYIMVSGAKARMAQLTVTKKNVTSPTREIYTAIDERAKATEWGNDRVLDYPVPLQNVLGVNKFQHNLVKNDECVNNSYVIPSTGLFAYNQSNYFRTGYIPVTAGVSYKANIGRNLAWYKSDKTFISGVSGTSIQSGVTAPENAAYIIFTVNKTTDGIDSPVFLYFTATSNFNGSVTIPGLIVSAIPWCYGKKINWIGDSIVDGRDFDEEVCEALGLVKENEYGINGSTIALHSDGTDDRNALCERYVNMSDDADIIAVSCGTNDFEYAWCPIGTIESTEKTTFYGALKTLCEGLINKYPQKVIFFTTPIKRAQPFASGAGGEYTEDGVMTTPFSKNKYGKTLGDYADIIKEVCGYYSIPVLDMYHESLLNPHITSQQNMFDSAYTHPNGTGQKVMARRVAGWLTQLGYTISGLT